MQTFFLRQKYFIIYVFGFMSPKAKSFIFRTLESKPRSPRRRGRLCGKICAGFICKEERRKGREDG